MAPGSINTSVPSGRGWYRDSADRTTTRYAGTASGGVVNGGMVGLTALGALNAFRRLPGLYTDAIEDIRQAQQSGQWGPALESTALAGATTLRGVNGALGFSASVAEMVRFRPIEQAARAALEAAGVEKSLAKGIATAAAQKAVLGQPLRTADVLAEAAKVEKGAVRSLGRTIRQALAGQLRDLGQFTGSSTLTRWAEGLERGVARSAVKVLPQAAERGAGVATKALEEAGEVAARAAAKGVLKSGATGLAKIAGRLAPGLNIAIAGLDVATAVGAWMDPKASLTKKISSTISAAGSIVAATNIPVVSQIGAGISIASTVVGGVIENFGAIKDGVKQAAHKVGDFFKGVGSKLGKLFGR